MSITVREISLCDFAVWDSFVQNHANGSFCHLSGWKTVVENGAGHNCPYLIAEIDDRVVGVLPLTLRRSKLFGDALISSMFSVYGGVLAESIEASETLEKCAWDYAQERSLKVVSYRTQKASHIGSEDWVVESGIASTFSKLLKSTDEDILLDIPRKQRAVVRKTLRNGLSCIWGASVDDFYRLYATSVHNLGTPVFPKKLFTQFVEVFGDDVEVQTIKSPDGKLVASLMSFYYKDSVLPYYAGGTSAARQYGAHDFMYYQLMVRAAAKGIKIFDFGRSKYGTGPYKFKKNWGFEPTPLEYQHNVANGATPPDLSPTNKKFGLMVKLWKRLPLPIANIIGPPIARHLG